MLSIKILVLFIIASIVTAQYKKQELYNIKIQQINNTLRNQNISTKCLKQLGLYYDGIINKKLWALQSEFILFIM